MSSHRRHGHPRAFNVHLTAPLTSPRSLCFSLLFTRFSLSPSSTFTQTFLFNFLVVYVAFVSNFSWTSGNLTVHFQCRTYVRTRVTGREREYLAFNDLRSHIPTQRLSFVARQTPAACSVAFIRCSRMKPLFAPLLLAYHRQRHHYHPPSLLL